MSYAGKKLGQEGEDLAAEVLRAKNIKIIKRNYRTKYGEIDILARDRDTLVVVEVKAKSHQRQGAAIEMITPTKQKKLVLLTTYLQAKHKISNVRIDVVTIDNYAMRPLVKYHKGIIELNG